MTKVLIVDDAAIDQKIAASCFYEPKYEVSLASNGEEALEAIRKQTPDLILTDLIMPKLDGLELVKKVRREFAAIPIILMTGQGAEDTALRALQAGAASFIPKQHLKQSLANTVETVLRVAGVSDGKDKALSYLNCAESLHTLGYEESGRSALIAHFERQLQSVGFCDEAEQIRISTALNEALANATDHGNLELDSELRETDEDAYRQAGLSRQQIDPYCNRRVSITCRLTPAEVVFIVKDDGPGFRFEELPDPTDPENLMKLSGRGLLLIRTFMDEVRFNETGNEITMLKRRRCE